MGLHFGSVGKDVFVDGYERPDVAASSAEIHADCQVHGSQRQPIIIVTHDECTFHANDGITKAWTYIGKTFLRPKSRGQGIMVSEFLLLYNRLSLASLSEAVRSEARAAGLDFLDAPEYIEYSKSHDGYWDRAKLLAQLKNKALPLVEKAFPAYSIMSLSDNATSHAIFADVARHAHEQRSGREAALALEWVLHWRRRLAGGASNVAQRRGGKPGR